MAKIKRENKMRILVAFAVFIVLILALALRTAWIQIVRADEYTEKAVAQQTSDLPVEASRGSIEDRNGITLATSAACYSIWVRPGDITSRYSESEIGDFATQLAVILDMDQDQVQKKMTSDNTLVQLAKYVDKSTRDQVKELNIYGIATNEGTKRYYPLGTSCSTFLGCVNSDNQGVAGLESEFNSYLSGISGRWIKETDINGNSLSYGKSTFYDATDGYNLVTTVDSVLQYYAEQAAENAMATYEPASVQILVMDPKTGDILAMAKTPNYDPNDPYEPVSSSDKSYFNSLDAQDQTNYLSRMWNNPLVSNLYEPGSTFKLVTAASALEQGVATTDTEYYCSNHITVSGMNLYCFQYHAHGQETLTQAVADSCNVAHVQMVLDLGSATFYDYLEMWGFTEKTGIALPAEAGSLIKNEDNLGMVDLATMGYGQGIAVTPIQLLSAISAMGNGGVLMEPRIVSEMTDSNGDTVVSYGTKKVRQVVSEKTAEEMLDVMEYEVVKGGGYLAAIDGYRIGGKTGTANKAVNGTYSDDSYCSFVALAPLDDPQLAVLVIVDTPTKKGFTGAAVVAPITGEFLENAFTYLGIAPKYSSDEEAANEAALVEVPDVTGLSKSEAIKTIEAEGLTCVVSPASDADSSFKVSDQYPLAGEKVEKNSTVYIYK